MKKFYLNPTYIALSVFLLGISYITVSAQEAETPIKEELSIEQISPVKVHQKVLDLMASTSLDVASATASLDNKEVLKRLDSIIKILSQINAKI